MNWPLEHKSKQSAEKENSGKANASMISVLEGVDCNWEFGGQMRVADQNRSSFCESLLNIQVLLWFQFGYFSCRVLELI